MPKQISALQMHNLWNIVTRNIPAAAVADWTDHFRRMSMSATSLDKNRMLLLPDEAPKMRVLNETANMVKGWGDDYRTSLPGDTSVRNQKELERSATTTNLYFAALERGDLASAFSLTSLDPALRRHWNARTQTLQQTSMVKRMLGKDKSDAYMTNKERVTFYHKYIENARNKQTKAYNEYLLYMYMYGCVIHAILNSMLHAKGVSLTESQYRVFLKALYDNADTFFNSSDFGKSFALTKNDKGEEVVNIGGSGTKHIIPKSTNIEAAKQIREILHNKVGIDMSDIYISDKEIEDGYALTAEEGTKANKHKVAQDVMTKALLDSLEGRNTKAQEGEERLWIGRMLLGGGQ